MASHYDLILTRNGGGVFPLDSFPRRLFRFGLCLDGGLFVARPGHINHLSCSTICPQDCQKDLETAELSQGEGGVIDFCSSLFLVYPILLRPLRVPLCSLTPFFIMDGWFMYVDTPDGMI